MLYKQTTLLGSIPGGGGGAAATLSNLTIDTNKDWLDYDITNVGKIEAEITNVTSEFITSCIKGSSIMDLPANKVLVGVLGSLTNTGDIVGGSGHGIGGLLYATDTIDGKTVLYGGEGRVDGKSPYAGIWYFGQLGLACFNGDAFNGFNVGMEARSEIYAADGVTPLAQGTGIGLYIPPVIGGQVQYGILCKDDLRVDGTLTIWDSTGVNFGAITKLLGNDLTITSDSGQVSLSNNSLFTTGVITSGILKIETFVQDAEPTIAIDGYMAIWIDTNDSFRTYLIFRRGVGDQLKVELT